VVESPGALLEPVWFQRAREAGFDAIEILSREPMGEERLPLDPIYQDGALNLGRNQR
jgi:hypothetical protein